jgi:hypothetical protein
LDSGKRILGAAVVVGRRRVRRSPRSLDAAQPVAKKVRKEQSKRQHSSIHHFSFFIGCNVLIRIINPFILL